ncbi:exo-alpha-sialidase [Streptomyces sp. NPDC020965]|uniref:exo-alpha-sialidase n=1 Tax=Streptomyces sp. NPDC020965 TaxID=3365105 RepID=UPI0037AE1FD6
MRRSNAGGDPRTLMTLRVSRDSGKTWGPRSVVREGDLVNLLDNPSKYPDCECVRCVGRYGAAIPSRFGLAPVIEWRP